MSRVVATFIMGKRDAWSTFAVELSVKEHSSAREALGLGNSREFDYAYLNAITANASYRLIEYRFRSKLPSEQVNSCAYEIVKIVQTAFHESMKPLSTHDIFDRLGSKFEYRVIERALIAMQGYQGNLGLISPITDPRERLKPLMAWDALEDFIGIERIPIEGIERVLQQAVSMVTGERPSS
jgi:hypothetical protein